MITYIFAEDEISLAILNKILYEIETRTNRSFGQKISFNKHGCGNIKKEVIKYNNIAKTFPVVVLIDLDQTECAPTKINDYIDFQKNPMFVFRIAIREVEAWLFADRSNFASFLGVSVNKIPSEPESIIDPKQLLFNIARKSRKKIIREDIPPENNSGAFRGKNYNGRLKDFIVNYWDINSARLILLGKSLDRAIIALETIAQ